MMPHVIRMIGACHFFISFNDLVMKQKEGFLGGDVSKGYADFMLLGSDLAQLEEVVQFDDTRAGHEALAKWLSACIERHGLTRINCGVESTGGLENNWYQMLVSMGSEKPVRVARLNPSVVRDAARAELTANGSDAISARSIAMYLLRYAERVNYRVLDARYAGFRSVNNRISMVNKQRTQVSNEFKQLLYQSFPEILRYCRNGMPKWVLLLLREYPSALKLSRARPETISKIKGITLEKAQSLIALAKRTVASRQTASDEFLIKAMARDMMYKDEQLDELKQHLAEACKGPEIELLETIVGVGAYSAAVFMVEIEDIGRFPSPVKLASYFGVHPADRESGDKKKTTRMSKKGRPAMRAALFNCARTAVLYDPHFKALYLKHRANGKCYKQAIGVVMHKILRTIWAILSKRIPYNPEIDKANQLKHTRTVEDQEFAEIAAKRRMQDYDPTAPLSNKAARKRKALETSQSGNAEDVRDLAQAPTV